VNLPKENEMIKIKTENIIFLDIDHLREHLPEEYFMRLIERWSWFGKGVGNGGVSNFKNLITIMELNLKAVEIPIDEQEKVKSVIEAVKELKCDMVHEGFYEGFI
jgi:hypothetical protein